MKSHEKTVSHGHFAYLKMPCFRLGAFAAKRPWLDASRAPPARRRLKKWIAMVIPIGKPWENP
jgi:hypothetical protein